jgi:hypothetical protein
MNGIPANASGNFAGVLLTVPAGTAAGTYHIAATGATTQRSAGTGLIVQVPQPAPAASIAISPIRALPGAQVLVAGTGFQAGELVLLTFNSVLVQHVTASGSGSFTNGTFIVPNTLGAGQYKVLVVGATSGRGASAVLTVSAVPAVVTPKLYVNPSTVAPGGHATLSGSGFTPGEQIVMRLDTSLIGSVTADGAGSFSTSRTINASLGNHTLVVTGSTSNRVASATVHLVRPVTAGTSLSPSTAHRGNVVKVSGTNFAAGELVLIRFGSTLVQAKTADKNGRFSNTGITVPGNAPYGVTYISATGSSSGRSARAALHVTQSPPAGAHLKLSATSLHRGSTVSLSGSGYQVGEVVLIRYRGGLVQGVVADGKGKLPDTREQPIRHVPGVGHRGTQRPIRHGSSACNRNGEHRHRGDA